jgi:hypothetical protein
MYDLVKKIAPKEQQKKIKGEPKSFSPETNLGLPWSETPN